MIRGIPLFFGLRKFCNEKYALGTKNIVLVLLVEGENRLERPKVTLIYPTFLLSRDSTLPTFFIFVSFCFPFFLHRFCWPLFQSSKTLGNFIDVHDQLCFRKNTGDRGSQ